MLKKHLHIFVSAFFIGLLFYLMRGEIPLIIQTLAAVRLDYVAAGIALFCVSSLMLAKRLSMIFGVQETSISYPQAVNMTFIGYLFNNFLPTAVGGDIVKAYCGYRITGEKLQSVTAVLMDRIFGLTMFVLIPCVTVLFIIQGLERTIPITLYSVLILALGVLIILFNRRVAQKFGFVVDLLNKFKLGDKLVMLYDGMHHFKSHKKMIAEVSLISLGAQVLGICSVYLFIRALSADIDFIYVLLLTPVVHLISMVPSINGLGVREAGFVYFFKGTLGVHNASALAILYLFLLFFLSLVGAAIYVCRRDYHFRLKEIEKETPELQ